MGEFDDWDDDDPRWDDIRIERAEVWGFAAAVLLVIRGQASERGPQGESLHQRVKRQVPRRLWRTTLAEVQRLEPAELGTLIKPWLEGFNRRGLH